ncbi:unnamed protein product [Symbiodinium natans]|uniref:Uncharacterized protein n=1 Tax=Symbiodinium natans TaxID=878477 RepID=A0A812QSM9_9DINO|nr:unnamed protein product [Symbiodinium natans]
MDEHDSVCPVVPVPDSECTLALQVPCIAPPEPVLVVPPVSSVGASLSSVHPPSDPPHAEPSPLLSVGASASDVHPPSDTHAASLDPLRPDQCTLACANGAMPASALPLHTPFEAPVAADSDDHQDTAPLLASSVSGHLQPACTLPVPTPHPLSDDLASLPASHIPSPAFISSVSACNTEIRAQAASFVIRITGLLFHCVRFNSPGTPASSHAIPQYLLAHKRPARPLPAPVVAAGTSCVQPAPYIRNLTAPLSHDARGSVATQSSIICAFESARDKLVARWLSCVTILAGVSALFVEASASSDPEFFICRVVMTHAPSTLQRYLDMWSAWCLYCEIRRSSTYDPQPGVLPDWLRARCSTQGLATMPFKALSWVSKKAGLPLLRRQLESAIIRAFLSPSAPVEHRESLPFSLSFTAWLEARVLCPDTPPAEIFMLGVLLAAIWASLRWGDLLWIPPARLHFQAPSCALVGICIRTKTTKSGMPWGIYSPGLLGSAAASWTTRWLSVVKQVLADTAALHPQRVIDFLPAILSSDHSHPTIIKPLYRDQAVPWIRSLLCHHWNLHSTEPLPSAFNLIAAHSAKTTILSWARQLDMPAEPRRIQGHHRLSGSDKSVALYSRDDIGPMLCCQRTVISCIRAGFRPLQPLARGCVHPLPDFPVDLPSSSALPRVRWSATRPGPPSAQPADDMLEPSSLHHDAGISEVSVEADIPCAPLSHDPDPPVLPDLLPDYERAPTPPVSSCSSENDCGSVCSEPPSDPEALEVESAAALQPPSPSASPALLLYNSRSNVTHAASPCDPNAPRALWFPAHLCWLRPACGAQTDKLDQASVVESPPPACTLCLRTACAKRFDALD